MEILLFAILALNLISALTGGAALWLLARRPDPVPDDPPWDAAEPADQADKKAMAMDRGFENLMAYQVSLGRGRTTGGEA